MLLRSSRLESHRHLYAKPYSGPAIKQRKLGYAVSVLLRGPLGSLLLHGVYVHLIYLAVVRVEHGVGHVLGSAHEVLGEAQVGAARRGVEGGRGDAEAFQLRAAERRGEEGVRSRSAQKSKRLVLFRVTKPHSLAHVMHASKAGPTKNARRFAIRSRFTTKPRGLVVSLLRQQTKKHAQNKKFGHSTCDIRMYIRTAGFFPPDPLWSGRSHQGLDSDVHPYRRGFPSKPPVVWSLLPGSRRRPW